MWTRQLNDSRVTDNATGKAYQVNITSAEAVEKAVDQAVADFNGRLDIFIANSGIPWTQGPALDGELAHYQKVVRTDLDGTFYSARAAGKHWRRQKAEGTTVDGKKLENFTYGSFVATASMSGHIVNIPQLQAAYNAAKAGVIHLCKSIPDFSPCPLDPSPIAVFRPASTKTKLTHTQASPSPLSG
jgi:sorbose reductase